MTAYNELSGVPACMNPDLQPLVKDKWGLEFIVTDGADFSQKCTGAPFPRHPRRGTCRLSENGNDVMTDADDMVAAAARDALDRGLLTEQTSTVLWETLCPAVSAWANSTATACPYNTEPAETDTLLHRAVNRVAAMEQMCLLHNNGILPLHLRPGAKVAVIGPLGSENYRDWYTGISSYAISVADGLRRQLGEENVLFDDGYDVTALQSVQTGKYFSVAEDGTLHAAADTVGEREKFLLHDWDSAA